MRTYTTHDNLLQAEGKLARGMDLALLAPAAISTNASVATVSVIQPQKKSQFCLYHVTKFQQPMQGMLRL